MKIDLGLYKIYIKGLINLNKSSKLPRKNCLFSVEYSNGYQENYPKNDCVIRIRHYTPMVEDVPDEGTSIPCDDVKEVSVSLKDDFKEALSEFLYKYIKKQIKKTVKTYK